MRLLLPVLVACAAWLASATKHKPHAQPGGPVPTFTVLAKGSKTDMAAGKALKISVKVINNLNARVNNAAVRIVLPQGTQFRQGSAFPGKNIDSKTPAVENLGTVVTWRGVDFKPHEKRYFKIKVGVLCQTFTPLVFPTYTALAGGIFLIGPVVQVCGCGRGCGSGGQSFRPRLGKGRVERAMSVVVVVWVGVDMGRSSSRSCICVPACRVVQRRTRTK